MTAQLATHSPNSDAFYPPGLVLDPQIGSWVLLPIFLVMLMQGLIRSFMQQYLKSEKVVSRDDLERTNVLRRSNLLRANSTLVPFSAFASRQHFLLEKVFKPVVDASKANEDGAPEMPQMPTQDPMAAMGMMKQSMGMIIPQMILMPWISYFFSGFVLGRMPFSLSDRFKVITQRGISLASLDPSYVSSLSWYAITLFGLRGLYSILLGRGQVVDQAAMMQKQMQAGGAGMQAKSPAKLYETESTELKIHEHAFDVAGAEQRLLAHVASA